MAEVERKRRKNEEDKKNDGNKGDGVPHLLFV